ncbi:MAG: STAS domain-containing protein [Candidatus Kapaibacteriota bacterium]
MDVKFRVESERFEDIKIFKLFGILDAHTAPIMEKELNQTIADVTYKIIINLKNLEYISSAGLGVFMEFIEEIRNNNGDIKFVEMEEKVLSIFELLGFHLIFDILPSNNEAINYLKNNNLRRNV